MKLSRSCLLPAVLILFVLFCPGHEALAQGGSTGGEIGRPISNSDKTVSGGEDQKLAKSRTKQPSSGKKDTQRLPLAIKLNQYGLAGNYSATLRLVRGNLYEAIWNVPTVSDMRITLTKEFMTIHRQDTKHWIGILYSETYSGERSGKSASGTFSGGTWDASW